MPHPTFSESPSPTGGSAACAPSPRMLALSSEVSVDHLPTDTQGNTAAPYHLHRENRLPEASKEYSLSLVSPFKSPKLPPSSQDNHEALSVLSLVTVVDLTLSLEFTCYI